MGPITSTAIGTYGGEKLSSRALTHYLGRLAAVCISEYREFERVKEQLPFERQSVHVFGLLGVPDPKSYASAVLLRNYYSTLDKEKNDRYDWRKWVMYRYRYLRRIKKERGELVCEYCGKRGLHIEKRKNNSYLATIDHIKPIALGGDRYDEKNFAVVCFKCNQRKGTDDYTMLMMRRRDPVKYMLILIKRQICTFLRFLSRL